MKKICELPKKNETCSFPYKPTKNSPEEGKGKFIIFDMMLNQNESPTDEKAEAMRNNMIDFFYTNNTYKAKQPINTSQSADTETNILQKSCLFLRTPHNLFLTTPQVRKLFLVLTLRSFITRQKHDSTG